MDNRVRSLDLKIRNALEQSQPNCDLYSPVYMGKNFEDEVDRRCGNSDITHERGVMKKFLSLMWNSPHIPNETYDSVYNCINFDDFTSVKTEGIDYKSIVAKCKHKTNCHTIPKYNVIVPVRNRQEHLDTFLKNTLTLFKEKKDWCLTLIFQEDTEESFERSSSLLSMYPLIHIIDMPHDEGFYSKYGSNMNRSLCYNVASMIVECEFQINHDVDLLFGKNFINNVESKTEQEPFLWLQPYRGSRVILMTEDQTKSIKGEIEKGNNVSSLVIQNAPPLRKTPDSYGATGGSVVVRHKVFREIGGYDPELVWGYAPEDIIFWLKLEIYFKTYQRTESYKLEPFCCRDVFSHETDVELFHMYHPPTETDRRYPYFPLFIANWLMNIATDEEHAKWLEISREQYEQFYNNDGRLQLCSLD